MNSILLVEDDISLNRGVSFKLKKEGFTVHSAYNIKEAMELFANNSIDLVILDVTLPDGSGFDFCSDIRKHCDVMVIFLTACDQEVDMVRGYDVGGDDYIVKPFSLMVLISKINAMMRRNRSKNIKDIIQSGDIIFYPLEMKVIKNDQELSLSKTELKLIQYLMNNSQQIITKDQLLKELWDIDGAFVDENTLAVNIRRLREKIEENPSKPKYIKNVRGVGYIWVERCVSR